MNTTGGRGGNTSRGRGGATPRGRGSDTFRGRGMDTSRGRGPGRGSGTGRGMTPDDGGCFFQLQRLAMTENYTEAREDVMYRYGVPARTTPYGQVSVDPHMDALLNYDATNYSQYPDIPENSNAHVYSGARNSPRGDSRSNPSPRTNSVPVVPGGSSSEANNMNEEVSQQNMPSPAIPATVGGEDRRILITPVGTNHFDPPKIVKEIGARCIGTDFKPGWNGMKNLEQATFEAWFERFSQIAKWDPVHELEIRHNFRVKCGDIIKTGLYNVRKKRSLKGPAFVNPEVIRSLEPIWESDPKFLAASERNKKNCMGEKNGKGHSVHRCGPHPIHEHTMLLGKELEREPIYGEVYDRVKCRPDGTYVDPDGEYVKTSYDKRRLELLKSRPSGSTISPAEDLEILTDLVGVSQRTKLPRVVGVAATLTPGTRYFRQNTVTAQAFRSQQHASQEANMAAMFREFTESFQKNFETILTTKLISVVDERISRQLKRKSTYQDPSSSTHVGLDDEEESGDDAREDDMHVSDH